MPLYEFQCAECGEVKDVKRELDDRDKVEACPKCAKDMNRVLFSKNFSRPIMKGIRP